MTGLMYSANAVDKGRAIQVEKIFLLGDKNDK
jgi:hypothetical protein